jgi:hypothetical protein
VIAVFCIFMGVFAVILNLLGLGLGWVYLFMGIVIGSAVIPLWNMMMWSDANATGAIVAAWVGQIAALIVWIAVAAAESGEVTVATLGGNYPMLCGNLVAIFFSGFIHYVMSKASPQKYDWESMKTIKLIDEDLSGLGAELYDDKDLEGAFNWIMRRGWALTIIFVIIWPALSLPAGVFTKSYFAFWVFISLIWGFTAAAVIIGLPLYESWDSIMMVWDGLMGKEPANPPLKSQGTDVVESPGGAAPVGDGLKI